MQASLRVLGFAARIKLRRDKYLEISNEGRGSKSPHRNQAQEERRQVFGEESLRT
jgi:hypothetical protein